MAKNDKGENVRYFIYKDSSGRTRKYFPDFKIGNKIVETKSNYWLHQCSRTPKYDCMIEHGVEVWTDKDVKPYFDYCEKKYGTRKWSDHFKYTRD